MKKERLIFKIVNKDLTSERKKRIAKFEVFDIGRPPRVIIAAGGAYMFLYGTGGDIPESVVPVAFIFAVVGILAVLLAIFLPGIIEASYFAKTRKQGSFPSEVLIRIGGIYIDEIFAAFSAVRKIEDRSDFFKVYLVSPIPCFFLFKEDFELGQPEAFIDFLLSKRSGD